MNQLPFMLLANVDIKLLTDSAKIPTRGSEDAAGYDLYADTDAAITIHPHETIKIPTGIAMALPQGTFGAIFARSGLATKSGLRPANCVGVIDSDYRGEIIVALHNDSETPKMIEAKERIAQLVVLPYIAIKLNIVDSLGETKRGEGGFGSTGTL